MAQQTAVEWLHLKLKEWANLHSGFDTLIEQAKEMDKQQKKDAWDRGQYIGQSFPKGNIEPEYEQDAEEYYYATYKNK